MVDCSPEIRAALLGRIAGTISRAERIFRGGPTVSRKEWASARRGDVAEVVGQLEGLFARTSADADQRRSGRADPPASSGLPDNHHRTRRTRSPRGVGMASCYRTWSHGVERMSAEGRRNVTFCGTLLYGRPVKLGKTRRAKACSGHSAVSDSTRRSRLQPLERHAGWSKRDERRCRYRPTRRTTVDRLDGGRQHLRLQPAGAACIWRWCASRWARTGLVRTSTTVRDRRGALVDDLSLGTQPANRKSALGLPVRAPRIFDNPHVRLWGARVGNDPVYPGGLVRRRR